MSSVLPRQCANQLAHSAHAWADVLEGDQACYCNGVTLAENIDVIDELAAAMTPYVRTRAEDEPVFTIRAQDIIAPQALAAYAALARKLDLHDHAQRVEAIAVDFLAWQAAHAKQVKRPD